jgi:hypothetical protein
MVPIVGCTAPWDGGGAPRTLFAYAFDMTSGQTLGNWLSLMTCSNVHNNTAITLVVKCREMNNGHKWMLVTWVRETFL